MSVFENRVWFGRGFSLRLIGLGVRVAFLSVCSRTLCLGHFSVVLLVLYPLFQKSCPISWLVDEKFFHENRMDLQKKSCDLIRFVILSNRIKFLKKNPLKSDQIFDKNTPN